MIHWSSWLKTNFWVLSTFVFIHLQVVTLQAWTTSSLHSIRWDTKRNSKALGNSRRTSCLWFGSFFVTSSSRVSLEEPEELTTWAWSCLNLSWASSLGTMSSMVKSCGTTSFSIFQRRIRGQAQQNSYLHTSGHCAFQTFTMMQESAWATRSTSSSLVISKGTLPLKINLFLDLRYSYPYTC